MSGDDDGVTGESDMGDHELAPLPDNHPGDRGHGGLDHHGGYSDHDREMSYDREQKYMSKYGGGLVKWSDQCHQQYLLPCHKEILSLIKPFGLI